MRHILHEGWHMPPWYEGWIEATRSRDQKQGELNFEA